VAPALPCMTLVATAIVLLNYVCGLCWAWCTTATATADRGTWMDAIGMADAPAPIPAVLDDDHRDPRDWMAGESGMAWMAIVERD